jgi:hypothetical protein
MGNQDDVCGDGSGFPRGVRVERIRDNRQADRRTNSKATMAQPLNGDLAGSDVGRFMAFVSRPASG